MSSKEVEEADVCCANCGVAEVDDIKLEDCDGGCDLVKYCGDKCKEVHKEKHEEDCMQRQKKLHDKELFRHPDGSHLGECPLCFLPLPLEKSKSIFFSCCCNTICQGCRYAHQVKGGSQTCPFCREPAPRGEEEIKKRLMKRIKANDPAAMSHMGGMRSNEGDHDTAIEYWAKAAELGDPEAHFQLADSYHLGKGVEKDEEKAVYHLEKAAISGHHVARYNLGYIEGENGNLERAVKHFIIAANLGYEDSMQVLWGQYAKGNITKEDLDATLRTHHAAINEMKSSQREEAEIETLVRSLLSLHR